MDRDFRILRWVTFAALLAVAVAYLLPIAQANRIDLPAEVALVVLAAALLTWAIESWIRLLINRATPPSTQGQLQPESRALLALSRSLFAAQNAQETLQEVMRFGCENTGAQGCTFVPYDVWGKSLPALVYGAVPRESMQTWVETLSAPATHQTCQSCQGKGAQGDCLLLGLSRMDSVRCINLTREGHEVGVLNFYFKNQFELRPIQQTMLREAIHLTDAALQYFERHQPTAPAAPGQEQPIRPSAKNLRSLLQELAASLGRALESDFSLIWLSGAYNSGNAAPILDAPARSDVQPGAFPDSTFLEGVWRKVAQSRAPLTLENVAFNARDAWGTLLSIPLVWEHGPVTGLLMIGSKTALTLSSRQLMLVQTLAAETALLIQNNDQAAQAEFQAVVDERARLAREIHDGLAQTLAILKMQSAQMQTYLEKGDLKRLTDVLRTSGATLADAYLDARQAIDQLRRVPGSDLTAWLCQVALDFEAATGLAVDTAGIDLDRDFSPIVQSQLVRIVQEALSNVRKHAGAGRVAISGRVQEDALYLEVADDGVGFAPDNISSDARFGLHGMRERAEMLGADFQVISCPGHGAVVHVRLPLEKVP